MPFIFIGIIMLSTIIEILVFLIVGLFIVFFGYKALTEFRRIKKFGIVRTGIIISFVLDDDGCKIPIIEFTTITGEKVSEKPYSYVLSDVIALKDKINQNVSIKYDPDNSKIFVLNVDNQFEDIVHYLVIFMGLVFIGISIANILR